MLPRGEVGLIFATIGLQNGVLGDDLYAALLLVVLVTTLITPPLLKYRYGRLRAAAVPTGPSPDTAAPDGGWLTVADGEIDLAANPPLVRGLAIGLRAAIIAGRHGPTQHLLDWLTALPKTRSSGTTTDVRPSWTWSSGAMPDPGACSSPRASWATRSRSWSWPCAIARPTRCPSMPRGLPALVRRAPAHPRRR